MITNAKNHQLQFRDALLTVFNHLLELSCGPQPGSLSASTIGQFF